MSTDFKAQPSDFGTSQCPSLDQCGLNKFCLVLYIQSLAWGRWDSLYGDNIAYAAISMEWTHMVSICPHKIQSSSKMYCVTYCHHILQTTRILTLLAYFARVLVDLHFDLAEMQLSQCLHNHWDWVMRSSKTAALILVETLFFSQLPFDCPTNHLSYW